MVMLEWNNRNLDLRRVLSLCIPNIECVYIPTISKFSSFLFQHVWYLLLLFFHLETNSSTSYMSTGQSRCAQLSPSTGCLRNALNTGNGSISLSRLGVCIVTMDRCQVQLRRIIRQFNPSIKKLNCFSYAGRNSL